MGGDRADGWAGFASLNSGGFLVIDIGAATGGDVGLNTVTLEFVTSVGEDAFIF